MREGRFGANWEHDRVDARPSSDADQNSADSSEKKREKSGAPGPLPLDDASAASSNPAVVVSVSRFGGAHPVSSAPDWLRPISAFRSSGSFSGRFGNKRVQMKSLAYVCDCRIVFVMGKSNAPLRLPLQSGHRGRTTAMCYLLFCFFSPFFFFSVRHHRLSHITTRTWPDGPKRDRFGDKNQIWPVSEQNSRQRQLSGSTSEFCLFFFQRNVIYCPHNRSGNLMCSRGLS